MSKIHIQTDKSVALFPYSPNDLLFPSIGTPELPPSALPARFSRGWTPSGKFPKPHRAGTSELPKRGTSETRRRGTDHPGAGSLTVRRTRTRCACTSSARGADTSARDRESAPHTRSRSRATRNSSGDREPGTARCWHSPASAQWRTPRRSSLPLPASRGHVSPLARPLGAVTAPRHRLAPCLLFPPNPVGLGYLLKG